MLLRRFFSELAGCFYFFKCSEDKHYLLLAAQHLWALPVYKRVILKNEEDHKYSG